MVPRLLLIMPIALLTSFQAAGGAERLVLVAGGGKGADGVPAPEGELREPFAVGFDGSGSLFIAELGGERVRKVDPKGILTTVAGTGEKGEGGDGGAAIGARFNGMHHLLALPDGEVFIADTWNQRVRRIDPRKGTISAFAGSGEKGFAGDGGPAVRARFGGVYCLALDPGRKRMLLADLDNRRIRSIAMETGLVSTVAGNGERGVPEDGAEAVKAPLVDPRAVAVDSKGNIYILERTGNALRVVDPAGRIRTVAGTGQPGSEGDGGEAPKALLRGPKHLSIDRDDSVLIADTDNHLIRRYLPREGRIVRVAGTGKKGTAGLGGPPGKAELNMPHGVAVHPGGQIYIVDSGNHRLLRIERD